jgi:D-3-phosphoglycerate dehydrogenase
MKKVLITDLADALLAEGLTKAGFICDYRPEISYTEVLDIICEYTGVVINSKILVNKDFLSRAKNLRFVARLGSGLEIIDLAAAAAAGVAVHSSPAGNCDAVAEQAMAMLLALLVNLRRADAQVRNFDWQREANRGSELMSKTVAIIGFGHTGAAFAKRLSGFGCQILAYDKYKQNYAPDYVQESTMAEIFERADVLSFHLPLTAETTHLANNQYFSQFQKDIILVNTARGQIIRTDILLAHLKSGKISAAALDVFENEKPNTFSATEKENFAQLYALQNIILSPHIAGWTHESKKRLAAILLNKILAGSY